MPSPAEGVLHSAPPGPWDIGPARVLLASFAVAAAQGVVAGAGWNAPWLGLVMAAMTSACLCYWALADARRRGRPIPAMSQSWFFVLAGIAVPAYAVWTRGWRGALGVALVGVGWVVTAGVAAAMAAAVIRL